MSSAVDLKTKEEKDAELDKRIEALRKKNEALVKRYQEIEEDKKKAEQEGIAVTTTRKPRTHEAETDRRKTEKENLLVPVDISKTTAEKRNVNDLKPVRPRGRKSSEESDGHLGLSEEHSPPRGRGSWGMSWRGQRGGGGAASRQERRDMEQWTSRDGDQAESGGQGRRGGRRGRGGGGRVGEGRGSEGGGGECIDRKSKEWEEKRRQNIEKMNEEMERMAEYEKGKRQDGDMRSRNFLDDPRRSGPTPDTDRKDGSRRHIRNWGGLDFDNVKTGAEREKEWTSRRPGQKGFVDMTMSMTGRERAEYLRWKKEREQIDEERLARHRNAKGQWRREWDAQKTEGMFKEDPSVATEGITPEHGNRRDDSKRPPKAQTLGDFLSQGRTQRPRGEPARERGRGQTPSYSMHDNRWEGQKEEDKEKEDITKKVTTTQKRKKQIEESEPPTEQKAEENNVDEDEEEWEDATDSEEYDEAEKEVIDLDHDSNGEEKKDKGKEKLGKIKEKSTSSPSHLSQLTSVGSVKEQRSPRPRVHIPSPAQVQESPEGVKPVSPFSPLDSHRPVTDWGEEMEMLSPRSSMGADSPLKPASVEGSPPQKKDQDTESQVSSFNEPADQQNEKTVIVSQTECAPTDSPTLPPSSPSLSEVRVATLTMVQDSPTAPSQADSLDSCPSPAMLETEQSPSEPAGGKDENTATAGVDALTTGNEQAS